MKNYSVAERLALMQLSDSFFPSGSFTLSHGLEALVQGKQIESVSDLKTFLRILLINKIATCDLVALIHAYRGSKVNNLQKIRLADKHLFAQTLIQTSRETQRKSGRALLMVAFSTWENNQLGILQKEAASNTFNCLHPVVFGVVSQVAGITEENSVLAFLHSFVTGLLGAAIRLGIIGHIQTQKLLLELSSDIELAYKKSANLSLTEMSSCTPTIDIAQMQHSKLNTKLFAS